MKLAVAIHIQDNPERIFQTLEGIFAGIAGNFDLTLIADGLILPETYRKGGVLQIRILHFPEAVGAPLSMNTWIANCDPEITHFLFLENGLILGHSCVSQLLKALDSSPDIGLAGPSTNSFWNNQQAGWKCGGTLDEVHLVGAKAESTFRDELASLAPLYSLGPFCLAFKRELSLAIGGADPAYKTGPCWEMDFHIRAERAGFRGVWVKGAYAWRAPASGLVRSRDAALFNTNKFLYQDRFCALKLLSKNEGYEPHCKGDVCEHFAPADLIRTRIPLPPPAQEPRFQPDVEFPLVSCIMPTTNRPHFVALAITFFLRQDYPHKEMVIVYDKPSDLPASLPENPLIRYHQMDRVQSIGNKRNAAIELSKGSIIALWDDDDWYHSSRLRMQAMPILLGLCDMTGPQYQLMYSVNENRFWQAGVALMQKLFVRNVVSGCLMFQRSLIARGASYPNVSMREDLMFLERAINLGGKLMRITAQGFYIYMRHGKNTWKFQEGIFLQPHEWHTRSMPAYFAPDAPLYDPYRNVKEVEMPAPAVTSKTLVTCIMPTADRPAFIGSAIRNFLTQDYPQKELIILDDGSNSIRHLVPEHPQIQYHHSTERRTIGAKRNMACKLAKGEIILHWDDDDWVANTWISTQVTTLIDAGADVTGLSQIRFFDPQHRLAWKYQYPMGQPSWVYGATLCYLKSFWERNPFKEINIGEDNAFVWSQVNKVIVPHQGWHLFAARVHTGNTSAKRTNDGRWSPLRYDVIEEMMR